MKVSKQFIADFDYLGGIYKWNAEDITEMKEWIRSAPEQNVPYIANLAGQWRKAEGLA
jgi:hypothetical protein